MKNARGASTCILTVARADVRRNAGAAWSNVEAYGFTENLVAKKPSYKDSPAMPAQPGNNEQSGSTGRPADTHERGRATDAGQERYGQSGGPKQGPETMGQKRYRQSNPDGSAQP